VCGRHFAERLAVGGTCDGRERAGDQIGGLGGSGGCTFGWVGLGAFWRPRRSSEWYRQQLADNGRRAVQTGLGLRRPEPLPLRAPRTGHIHEYQLDEYQLDKYQLDKYQLDEYQLDEYQLDEYQLDEYHLDDEHDRAVQAGLGLRRQEPLPLRAARAEQHAPQQRPQPRPRQQLTASVVGRFRPWCESFSPATRTDLLRANG
jgi:hypothetical protein